MFGRSSLPEAAAVFAKLASTIQATHKFIFAIVAPSRAISSVVFWPGLSDKAEH
jgi:hypothetical protein